MRRAALVAAPLVALAVVFLVLASSQRQRAFSLGVASDRVAARVRPGLRLCQRGVTVPGTGAFRDVQIVVGTYHRPGPRLDLVVERDGRRLSGGVLPGGYPDIDKQLTHLIRLDHEVGGDQVVDVCLTNHGHDPVAFFGAQGSAVPLTYAQVNTRVLYDDVDLIFSCMCRRSGLERLPAVVENASLFKLERVGAWLLWTLLVLTLVVVPLALVRALRD